MIIIPVMKKMVDQLTPELALSEAPYQKSARKIAPRFRAFLIASQLCIQMPEHDYEHERRAAERDILALEFVHDDERKHADKDDGRKNLSSHGKNLLS